MSATVPDPIEFSTLVDLLRARAMLQPEQRAITFLVDGELEEIHLTFAELDRRARAIAAKLQSLAAPGARALLTFPPGFDYIAAFFGCLYAGVIAVPVYPPRPHRPDTRLEAIVADAQPAIGLTTTTVLSDLNRRLVHAPYLGALQWVAADEISTAVAKEWREPGVQRDRLAFLQYTSGSTAAPKGVMLTHRNLLHNLSLILHSFELTPAKDRFVSWLPPYHDMGLIGTILEPIYAGFPVTLMAPVAFVQRPLRWLQAVSRTRATVSGGPNFAFELCVRKITAEERAGLDLSHWDTAFVAAERVRSDTLKRFAEAFEPCGFRWEAFSPCYGLAEATLAVSNKPRSKGPVLLEMAHPPLEHHGVIRASEEGNKRWALVGCGQMLFDQKVVIVDPETCTRRAPGEIGEVWVASPSVAQGYWNRSEATGQVFRAHIADTGEGPFLRTGDLGFIKDGQLFITGRIKDMIVVDGIKHHAEDIEVTAEQSHPAVPAGACAAFSIEIDGEERLVIAVEIDRHRHADAGGAPAESRPEAEQSSSLDLELVDAITRAVAQHHDLRVFAITLLRPGTLPKTSSGKVQRHACKAGFLNGTLKGLDFPGTPGTKTHISSRCHDDQFPQRVPNGGGDSDMVGAPAFGAAGHPAGNH